MRLSRVLGASLPALPSLPRLGSIGRGTIIYATPSRKTDIGEIRPGTWVTLRRAETVEGARGKKGCASGRWYEVEPRGFVCEDASTTLDLDSPLFQALAYTAARDSEEILPFDYAFSTGAPMYGRLPTERETREIEQRYRPIERLHEIKKLDWGHEDLAEAEPIAPSDPLPDFLAFRRPLPASISGRDGLLRKRIPHGSMLSYRRAFEVEGRTFLLTPELSLVPADRVRPFHPSSFHGVRIGNEVRLPIGWFRGSPKPKYRRNSLRALVDSGERWAPRTFVSLGDEHIEQNGILYYETNEAGSYVREEDISIVREPEKLPKRIRKNERWIDVSLGQGTLTLFEGKRVVYSTLMSPGAGGTPPSASLSVDELVAHAYSPLGTYRIAVKYRYAQMTPEETADPEKFWIADVPYTQYFRAPFAIHTAYWHEDFGMPKSGGCINLSPADAKIVFDWTEPSVPDEWWSVRASPPGTVGTQVVIRR